MANEIKLTLVSTSKTGKSLVLKDTTGVYDVTTNPGGYGVPNPYTVQISAVGCILRHKLWNDPAWETLWLTGANYTALSAAGYTFGSESNATALADGVHQFKLLPIKTVSSGHTFTNGSKTVNCPTFDPNALGQAGLQYVIAANVSNQPVGDPIEIDWTGVNVLGTMTLLTPWTGPTGTYTLWTSIEGDLKVLINKGAEACITGAIGKLSECTCDCSDAIRKLNQLLLWKFGADVQMDRKDYDGAHNMVVTINKLCSSCNCGC